MQISYKGLWAMLDRKKLDRADLMRCANISASTVAKLQRNETVNMNVLLRICEGLNCDFGDIVSAVKTKK